MSTAVGIGAVQRNYLLTDEIVASWDTFGKCNSPLPTVRTEDVNGPGATAETVLLIVNSKFNGRIECSTYLGNLEPIKVLWIPLASGRAGFSHVGDDWTFDSQNLDYLLSWSTFNSPLMSHSYRFGVPCFPVPLFLLSNPVIMVYVNAYLEGQGAAGWEMSA